MAVIKLVEDYAVTSLRNDVRDALTMAGEQAILLQLYHPGDPDTVACPQCGDDVYHSAEANCTSCFGTAFDGGVRYAMKVWALFTDHRVSETLAKQGTYEPDRRHVQLEAFPQVAEHDMVVRVQSWDASGNPLTLGGYYELGVVDQRSERTGSRFGQASYDVVAQKADLSQLPANAPITFYPIIGQSFQESAQLNAPVGGIPSATLMPDTRVIYFPLEPAPGGLVPDLGGGVEPYTFTQPTPVTPWIITHGLGCEPSVSVIVSETGVDELVTADVSYPNLDTVQIDFQVPTAGSARLL
jgi:hypothetical protein